MYATVAERVMKETVGRDYVVENTSWKVYQSEEELYVISRWKWAICKNNM